MVLRGGLDGEGIDWRVENLSDGKGSLFYGYAM